MITLLAVGMRMGIGPFFLPVAHDLGFSRSLLSGIIAVGMLCYGLGMPLAGYLVARRGTPFVLLIGSAIVFVAAIWTANARGSADFLLAFGLLMSLGLAFTSPVALTPVLSRWFVRQRGMAFFFLSTGSMAGIAILTPVFTVTIDAFGWQASMIGFGALFAAVTVPMALLVIRDDAPADADRDARQVVSTRSATPAATPAMQFRDALRDSVFWKICAGLFVCGFSMNLIGTHGVPMLMDHGFDATSSSVGVGLIGFVAIFSTIVLGRISDILPRRLILVTIYTVRSLGFFALLIVDTNPQLYGAATLGGIAWAGSIAMSSAILADVYGVRLVGILYGLAFLVHQIGAMISAWLGGWAYETLGTHWITFGSAAVLLLFAAAVSLRLPDREPVTGAARA